jgi:hypothetical protein
VIVAVSVNARIARAITAVETIDRMSIVTRTSTRENPLS